MAKPKLDPNTVEFWQELRQGNDIKLLCSADHKRRAVPNNSHQCAVVLAIKEFSSLAKPQVRRGDIFVWIWYNEHERWCHRFVPDDKSVNTAMRIDDGTEPYKDTRISLRFDQKWLVEKRIKRVVSSEATHDNKHVHDGKADKRAIASQQKSATVRQLPTAAAPPIQSARPYQPRIKRSRWERRHEVHDAFGASDLPLAPEGE